MPTKEAPLPAGNCLWARAHPTEGARLSDIYGSQRYHRPDRRLPTPQLWYHAYQSGVEYSLKNRADEAGRVLFLVGAAIMASVAVYAVWRPRSVFDNVRIEHHELPIDDLGR